MLELLLIIIGLAGLWLGTEWVIKGAVNIAEYYQLSQAFIGIAILAIGTDLPELIISLDASLHKASYDVDTSGIILGNSIGSCIGQISAVLGFAGLFGMLSITKKDLLQDAVMLLGSIIVVILFGLDGQISYAEGGLLLVMYGIYYFTLIRKEHIVQKVRKRLKRSIGKDIVFLIAGLIVVIYSSDLVVRNAVAFAGLLNIRQSFVGIIIIGLGTSLPELALSLNASRKKAFSLSVGNLIGSNIIDILVPIGMGGSIAQLNVGKKLLWFDLPFLFVISLLVIIFFYRQRGVQRKEAIVLIMLFFFYAILKFTGF